MIMMYVQIEHFLPFKKVYAMNKVKMKDDHVHPASLTKKKKALSAADRYSLILYAKTVKVLRKTNFVC